MQLARGGAEEEKVAEEEVMQAQGQVAVGGKGKVYVAGSGAYLGSKGDPSTLAEISAPEINSLILLRSCSSFDCSWD